VDHFVDPAANVNQAFRTRFLFHATTIFKMHLCVKQKSITKCKIVLDTLKTLWFDDRVNARKPLISGGLMFPDGVAFHSTHSPLDRRFERKSE
jgi:hypothetical protein